MTPEERAATIVTQWADSPGSISTGGIIKLIASIASAIREHEAEVVEKTLADLRLSRDAIERLRQEEYHP